MSVTIWDGRITIRPSIGGDITLGLPDTKELRDHFQQERDEELGRWRWPENPDYICNEHDGAIFVTDERDGRQMLIVRDRYVVGAGDYTKAARAYFEAHPEPKPWHDAKPGELWAVVQPDHDLERIYQVDNHLNFIDVIDRAGLYGSDVNCITDARRIWPEQS